MTNSIELDNLSNSWDEHSVSSDHHDLTAPTQVVAQATPAEQAAAPAQTAPAAAAAEPVPVDVGGGAPAAAPPAANAPHEYVADASNVVKLPANVSIDNIKVDGHNLVLEQADGSVIVIKDGALHVPTFIIGDVEVPRVALIAALEASHVDVAFGADGSISAGGSTTSSAGGNFEQPAGGIGDGFGLSALLPPTDLQFGQPDHRELFPSLLPDSTPSIADLTPSVGGGDTTVNEKGLPASSGAEGSGELAAPGTDGDTSEHNTGTFTITSPDGVGSLTIAGQVISGAALANSASAPIEITTPLGNTLTINGYDASTGQVSYSYTLVHGAVHPGPGTDSIFDDMTLTVTDTDGDVSAPGTLSVQIIDDVPTANADIGTVPSGSHAAITGDVFVNDVFGADGKDAAGGVVGVAAGNTNANLDDTNTLNAGLHGTYGTLTLHADGSYSYVRDAGSPGGVNDVFTYTIKDGDGDLAHTTLTINIGDGTPHIDTVPATGGADTTVYEAGLGTRPGEPAGSHIGQPAYPTTVSGAVDISSPDGVAAVSLQGVTIASTNALTPTTVFSNSTGTLTAWYEATTATTGHIHYTYTLLDNTGDTNNTSIPVSIGVTDTDPSNPETATGTLTITIVDDVPTAHADTNSVTEGALLTVAAAAGVLANDVAGADGFAAGGAVTGVTTGSNVSNPVSGNIGAGIAGQYGTLVLNANGSYTYTASPNSVTANAVDHFVYTVTDGDGDTSTVTLDITVNNVTLAAVNQTGQVNEAALDLTKDGSDLAAGTVTGSTPLSTAETVTGQLTVTGTGVTYTPISTTTAHGVFALQANGAWTYTLTSPFDSGANQGANTLTGAESFTYTAKDANGNTVTGTVKIDVVDDVPTAHADTNSVTEGALLTVAAAAGVLANDVAGADGFAAGGAVTGVTTGSNVSNPVSGNIGAGIAGQYGTLVLNANGSYTYTASPNSVTANAVDHFVYTVTDGDGDTSTVTLDITVNNVTLAAVNQTGQVNEAALDLTKDGSDLAAGTVTGSTPLSTAETVTGQLTVTGTGVTYTPISTTTAHGVFALQANGAWTYTLTSPFDSGANQGANTLTGAESFTYTAKDANGNTVTGTVKIDVVDDVPTAHADTNSVTEGALLTVAAAAGVLANDVAGADGFAAGGAVTGVTTGSNVSNPVSGNIGAGIAGQYGTLVLNANGSYTYTASPNSVTANAVDHFVYTVTDGDGDTSTVTLDITVNNVTLAAVNQTGQVNEAALDLTKDGSDLAAGTVTGSTPLSTAETVTGQLTVTGTGVTYTPISTTTAHGVFALQANGAWTYTLTSPFDSGANQGANTLTGAESFTYTAKDANGNTVTGTVKIDVVDDVPTAHADTNSVTEGALLTVAAAAGVLANDVAGADGFAAGGAVTGVTTGSNVSNPVSGNIGAGIAGQYGTLVLNANGSYTYTASPNSVTANAVDHFVYTVTDGDGDTSTVTLDITVNNVTLAAVNQTGQVNEAALDLTKDGSDLAAGTVTGSTPLSTAETVTGQLTVTGTGVTYTPISTTTAHGVFALQANGAWTYTLTSPFDSGANQGANTLTGAESFTYTAKDANGNTVTGTVKIDVVDDVPTAHADTNSVTEGALLTVAAAAGVLANDVAGADGFAAGGAVTGVTTGSNVSNPVSGNIGAGIAGQYGTLVLNANGSYTYTASPNSVTANAVDHFVYTVTDGDGDTSTVTLDITVNNVTLAAVNQTGQVNEAALDLTKDGSDLAAGTVTGSTPLSTAETVTGQLTVTGTGVTYTPISTTTAHGVFALQANGAWTYTLTSPFDSGANQGANTLTGAESFTYTAKDANGNTVTGTVKIDVVDDVPTAHADTNSVTEGALLTVAAAAGVLANDVAGADGFAAGGAVTGVTTGSNVSNPVSGNIGAGIAGQYGTLVLNANGSYTYTASPNSVTANAVDHFVYTVTDGDGDTSTVTLDITVNNVTLAAVNQTGQVNEAALDLTKDGSDLAAGTVTGSTPLSTAETVTGQLTVTGTGVTYTPISTTTAHGVFALQANGAWTYTLTSPFDSGANQGANTLTGAESFTYTAKDANGNTVTGTVKIDVVDDVPTLGTVQNQQTNDDPSQAPAVGTLHFVAGADGAGTAMTITANTTGLTSAGHNLITEQVGNTLTAYADNNNNGTHDAGETAVFTITVNPSAGTSGQYTFNLLAPLDGTTNNVSIGKGSSFGSGPSQSVIVQDSSHTISYVMVTGWAPASGFNEADWLTNGNNQPLTQTSNVNGSTAGWGLGNNNFDGGEFMRFDFGTPNDYDGNGPYVPPNNSLANVSYATFTFDTVSASNKIEFVAHYTDGSSQAYIPANGLATQTITSPAGLQIAWIDVYESAGSTKLNLTDIGVTSTTVDHTIPVTVQLTDGDGDKTGTGNFTVHVADGLTPFAVAAPVLLDLNHDGTHTTDLTHSTVSYDYNGDGVASKTAWVDQHDGILAIDLNGDGKVSNASEFVFTQQAPGAATDLAALEQLYDTNHDGKLTAADHDFAKFGVWQDANGNGVADSGEFKSLAALGIVEIGLESNHQQSVSADGSVVTFGEATFTTADGQSGAVGDIGFGNYDGVATGATSTITGTSGADTFKIDNLNIKDLIADYHGAEGDKIDLTALFDKAAAGNIADYVHYNSATSTVSVDASGSGNAANFVDVAVLQNAPAAGTINILYDDATHTQQHVTI